MTLLKPGNHFDDMATRHDGTQRGVFGSLFTISSLTAFSYYGYLEQ